MYESLKAADRKVRLLRGLFAVAVVACGVVCVCIVIALALDAAVAAALLLPVPENVLPVTNALLSTASAIVAIYLVALPLYRNLSLPRFVAYLERTLGRETQLLTALELYRAGRQGELQHFSPMLVDEVGRRALADLAHIRLGRLKPVNLLYYTVAALLVVAGGTLWARMAYPDSVDRAMTRLFEPNAPNRSAFAVPQPQVQPGPRAKARVLPPCQQLWVKVLPPRYLGVRGPVEVEWGEGGPAAAGSVGEVRCHAASAGQTLLLERHSKAGVERVPMVEEEGAAGDRAVYLGRSVLTGSSAFFVARAQSGEVQPGRHDILAAPDRKPGCLLHQPAPELVVKPQDSIAVLAEAADDYGISAVLLHYEVEGLDDEPSTIELSRPVGEKRVVVQRDVAVSTFGADPDDRVSFFVEVRDANDVSGPGVCRTRRSRAVLRSPYGDQRAVIERLSGLRNRAVDLLGDCLSAPGAREELPEPVGKLLESVDQYASDLASISGQMATMSLFKQEDARRVAALTASVEEVLHPEESWELTPAKAYRALGALTRELEHHSVTLDGVVEKVLGEYLFYESGRIQQELARVMSLGREGSLGPAGARTMRRGLKKLNRAGRRVVRLRSETLPRMPALFTPYLAASDEEGFAGIVAVTARLLDSGAGNWKESLESLSLAVEHAARSVEGAYAQSMNRLSTSFRNARAEMTSRLKTMAGLNQTLKKQLEALLGDVEKETKRYIRRKRTIVVVQDVARKVAKLSRKARRFTQSIYLEVDRKQVVEFKEKLSKLGRLVSLLKVEEATGLARDLVVLTQSMEFSLKLIIRYSKDRKKVKKSRRELEKVHEAKRMAESVAAKLGAIRPQREKLVSLKPERLQELAGGLEELERELTRMKEKMEPLEKMFPIFFGRFAPVLDRLAENVTKSKASLASLMLDDTYRLVIFAEESIGRLQDALRYASGDAKSAGALAAGGMQPSLELGGKGETVSRERLERFLEMSTEYWEEDRWRELTKEYFSLLSQ